MDRRFRIVERCWVGGLIGFSLLFVIGLITVKWPRYWAYVASEMTPMTWWESVILFSCSMSALLCAALIFVDSGFSRRVLIWGILAAAFFFLTLDERFALHERVRDNWLEPRNVKLLPWVGAGDFLLLLYAVVGLLFLRYVLRELRIRKGAMRWFLVAVAIATITVIMDSFDVSRMSLAMERLEQTIEEILELGAMLAFLLAFSLTASTLVRQLIASCDE